MEIDFHHLSLSHLNVKLNISSSIPLIVIFFLSYSIYLMKVHFENLFFLLIKLQILFQNFKNQDII